MSGQASGTGVIGGSAGTGAWAGAGQAAGAGSGGGPWTVGTTVVDALRALRPDHREVIAETWLHGRSIGEVAQARGVPSAVLTQQVHEALRALAAVQGGRQTWDAGAHVGVAAYLLGLLDPEAAQVFSEHVTCCPGCRNELAALAPVVALLTQAREQVDQARPVPRAARAMAPGPDVTPARGFPRPDSPAPSGTTSGMAPAATRRTARARSRSQPAGRPRLLLLPIAATVALLAVGGAAGADELGLLPEPATGAPGEVSDTATPTVRRAQASDPRTGVAAEVEADPAPAGTTGSRVSVSVTGLTGPRSCRLVAVRRDGATQVLASWQVPASGYGIPGQPDPFTLSVVATAAVADLDGMQVESVRAGGRSTVLVRVAF